MPGFPIQIRWQSSDSSALGSFYVPASVVESILQTSRSSSTPTATSTDSASQGGSAEGLSKGIIAAIVVCACVAVCLIALSGWFVFRRKRRQLRAARQSPGPETGETGLPELPPTPKKNGNSAELPATAMEPDPEELPAGGLVPSTPARWRSPVQDIPELHDSSVPAPAEMPGHLEAQVHTAGGSSQAVGGVGVSGVMPQQDPVHLTEAVEDLIARQKRLEEKRQRLLQLQEIDEEQERIRRQLLALHDQQPIQRVEMP